MPAPNKRFGKIGV